MSKHFDWVNLADPSFSTLRTDWEKVALAKGTTPESEAARKQLAERYRSASYFYVRGIVGDPDLAHDLTQDFLLLFIKGKILPRAGPEAGSFRDFLKGSLQNHVHAAQRNESIRKMGSLQGVDLPDPKGSPEEEFDRRWATALLSRAREMTQKAFVAGARNWEVFDLWEFQADDADGLTQERAAARLGMTLREFRTALYATRQVFMRQLLMLLRLEVTDFDTLDVEIGRLREALAGPLMRAWRRGPRK